MPRKTEDMIDNEDLLEDEEILDDEDFEDEDLDDEDLDDESDEDEDEEIEESAGSETLKPHGGSGGGEYKAQTLSTFTALLSQLGKDDLSHLFNSVQSQYGPNKVPGEKDTEGKNKATIKAKPSDAVGKGDMGKMPMPKLSVKEDVEEMLGDDENLSEDFRERAETIFEAAVNTRVNLEKVRLAEAYEELEEQLRAKYETDLEENTQEILEDLTDKIDQYMNYCVEEWMEENKLAIESSLRAEIAENFINSLRDVFAEHYVEVPEERFDIMAEMKEELDSTKERLNQIIDENIELKNEINGAIIDDIIDTVSEGMTVTQTEKLRTLSEGIEFSDPETFEQKVKIVKENYFGNKKKTSSTGMIVEEIDGEDTTNEGKDNLHPGMSQYMSAISKSQK